MQDRIWESMKKPHDSESLTRGVGWLGGQVTTKQIKVDKRISRS